MKLEFYSQEKLKKEIIAVLSRYLDPKLYKVFFFGSRVRGDNFPRADIDIGIEGPQKIPAGIKLALKEEIDTLPTLYKFDIVDFKDVAKNFRREALRDVEYIKGSIHQ